MGRNVTSHVRQERGEQTQILVSHAVWCDLQALPRWQGEGEGRYTVGTSWALHQYHHHQARGCQSLKYNQPAVLIFWSDPNRFGQDNKAACLGALKSLG